MTTKREPIPSLLFSSSRFKKLKPTWMAASIFGWKVPGPNIGFSGSPSTGNGETWQLV